MRGNWIALFLSSLLVSSCMGCNESALKCVAGSRMSHDPARLGDVDYRCEQSDMVQCQLTADNCNPLEGAEITITDRIVNVSNKDLHIAFTSYERQVYELAALYRGDHDTAWRYHEFAFPQCSTIELKHEGWVFYELPVDISLAIDKDCFPFAGFPSASFQEDHVALRRPGALIKESSETFRVNRPGEYVIRSHWLGNLAGNGNRNHNLHELMPNMEVTSNALLIRVKARTDEEGMDSNARPSADFSPSAATPPHDPSSQ